MPTKSNSIGLFFLGVFIAAGLFSGCFYLGKTFKEVRLAGETIDVKGYAEEIVVSDRGSWTLPVVARHPSLDEASRLVMKNVEVAKTYMRDHKVTDDMMAVGAISFFARYKYDDKGNMLNTVDYYEAEVNIDVASNDVEQIQDLSRNINVLLEKGIEVRHRSPSYFYSDIDRLKVSLLGVATKNAYDRAEQFASNSGMTVGSIRSARQGVFQITPEYSTATDSYGIYDTSTIRKAVKAVVSISYSIKTDKS